MALPPLKTRTVDYQPSFGITLTISPSTQAGADVVLERTQVSSSGTWNQIGRLGVKNGAPATYVDQLPNDGVRRFYRAYEAEAGWNNSTYTKITSGYPDQLSQGYIQVPVTLLPLNAPLSLSTRANPAYASSSGPSFYNKSMIVPFTAFVANTSTKKWTISGGVTRPAFLAPTPGTTAQLIFYTDVVIPPGATLTGMKTALFRQSTKDSANAFLDRSAVQENAAVVVLSSMAASGSTWSFPSATFSETVSTGFFYTVRVILTASTSVSARFGWAQLNYKIPNLGVGI